jgi:ATP-dependent protease ClpP protease subunit
MKTLMDLNMDKRNIALMRDVSLVTTHEQTVSPVLPSRTRTLRYIDSVSRSLNEQVLKDMGRLLDVSLEEEIGLLVTSPGGTTGTAMNFYDTVRYILKPSLVTIGSGDVDSSGVILFLSGTRRYISKRTTVLLHPAGRVFGNQRYTTQEMEAMLVEDCMKDEQYASVVAENSKGRLTTQEVLALMVQHTVLSPETVVGLGLADAVLA